jgi:hypothetical protein
MRNRDEREKIFETKYGKSKGKGKLCGKVMGKKRVKVVQGASASYCGRWKIFWRRGEGVTVFS